MRLLISGGCGFIGSNLVRHVLATTGHDVVNLDAQTYAGRAGNLDDLDDHPRYRLVVGDVARAETVRPLVREADAVLHLAAESHVDRSITDASAFVRTNVLGTQVLLDTLRDDPAGAAKPLVHVSTDEVFGDLPLDGGGAFDADSPVRPSSPYAASKAAADHLCLAWHRTFGLDTRVLNASNNFGPWQFPEKVIPRFITRLLRGQTVPLYGDGRNVRDWLHVLDHCDAILAVLERGAAGRRYVVGGDNPRSNLELTRALLSLTGGSENLIERVPDRPGHDLRYAVDNTEASRALGWQPARSAWPGALAETVDWYRNHEAWWSPLLENSTER